MKEVFIKAISYYVPENIITNADIIKKFPDWSEQKISGKIGIKQRYVAKNLTAGDLAEKAALKLFEEHKIDRSSIDTLLLCTQSPDYFLPATSCVLQDKLGLTNSLMAFDFNQGCSGYVYGLGIAKSLIVSGIANNVLLLTAETYHKYIHKNDRGNLALFSDAAAATLISNEGFAKIGEPVYGTDGKGFKNLIVESGAHRMARQGIELNEETKRSPDYLYMDGPEIFTFSLDVVPLLVKSVLEKNNLGQDSIDLFIFHQANKHMLNYLKDALNIPDEKFYMCLENFGNTVSSTIPISLYHAIKDKSIHVINNMLIVGFGVGYSWGGLCLKFD